MFRENHETNQTVKKSVRVFDEASRVAHETNDLIKSVIKTMRFDSVEVESDPEVVNTVALAYREVCRQEEELGSQAEAMTLHIESLQKTVDAQDIAIKMLQVELTLSQENQDMLERVSRDLKATINLMTDQLEMVLVSVAFYNLDILFFQNLHFVNRFRKLTFKSCSRRSALKCN